jgi:ATP-dependent DNA helicase RecG
MLKDKSKSAHLLVMSATPIPRTLALTMYGDLDVSRITEMPKGRIKVETFVINESYRERLNTFISKQAENGGQCYIVCPSIEANDTEAEEFTPTSITIDDAPENNTANLKNVFDYYENLRQNLPSLRIAFIHGKMKASEKDLIMRDFSDGIIDVLISTTVIEVGINVPNASLIVIENAERFGLSQLHQLRGRVGRGTKKSYCVLVSDLNTEKSKARLDIMKNTYDGYLIAEKDLMLRGPGDFFASAPNEGMRQSGGFEFKLAKLCNDNELFAKAFAAAKEIIDKDPHLDMPEHKELHRIISKNIAPITSTIS